MTRADTDQWKWTPGCGLTLTNTILVLFLLLVSRLAAKLFDLACMCYCALDCERMRARVCACSDVDRGIVSSCG